ncbi:hypothetical protein SEPL_451 [Salmonella phage SE_PL]|nr:hypothetical protein 7t3_0103 [Salmonella phage 7t3]QIG63064.1 hypothetical protein SEPL_451 [Salmonella phage SE_PL]
MRTCLTFLIIFVLSCTFMYGIPIYKEWNELGKYVDSLDTLNKFAPVLISACIATFFTLMNEIFLEIN